MSDASQPPKASYRALLHLKANGYHVEDFELKLWRREEEIIRSALDFTKHYLSSELTAGHFNAPMHAVAWQAIQVILERSPETEEVDGAELLSEMRAINEDLLGGPRGNAWLAALMTERPVPPRHGHRLATDIFRHHRLRLWERRFGSLNSRVGDDDNFASLQADFVNAGLEISYQVGGEGKVAGPLTDYDWNPNEKSTTSLVETGIRALDDCGGGGHGRGELLVVGAGTSVGKSYLASQLIRKQGELGNRALYISAEDPEELFYCRMLADFTEPSVSPKEIRTKNADPEVIGRAQSRMRDVLGKRVFVVEAKKPTISQVLETIRTYRYMHDVDLVVVDYLQAITEDEPTTNKTQEMSSITSKLKRCFTECRVAGVALTQLNRESYKDGSEPSINSAKYAGDIENEAELIVMLWRDAEGALHAKLPKVKWSSARELRYAIPVNRRTGCFGEWEENFNDAS